MEKAKRDLDGVYFRMKRNDKWDNVCFSDLTKEEREEVMTGRGEEWLHSMCQILADTIYEIGEFFNLAGGITEGEFEED